MTERLGEPVRYWAHRDRLSLFWQVFVINGLVFTAGTATLVVSPATVSAPVAGKEIGVLAVGLGILLLANWLLLRASFAPLGRLMGLMDRVDMLRPGERLPESGSGDVARLIRTFNAMLTRLEAERGAASAHAIVAQEVERQRIARELHDEIGQGLTVVLLGLKRAADRTGEQGLREEIEQVAEVARASLDEVRHVARRLRPGELDDLGLVAALAALANDISTYSGTPVRRVVGPNLPALSREAELALYRVAQEALTNAARHAGASRLELSLSRQGGALSLRVSDDGQGIDGQPEGGGIRGMRERAMLIGADLRLGQRAGGGTEVCLLLPGAVEPV